MEQKKSSQRDWVEEKIDQLRKKIYASIQNSSQLDAQNSYQAVDKNFQEIITTISTLVQEIISEIFPKIAKAKQSFLTKMQKLDHNLEQIEASYKESKGDLKKSILVLQQIQSYSKELDVKLESAPSLPSIKINQKKIRSAIMNNIKIEFNDVADQLEDGEELFGMFGQYKQQFEEQEQEKKEIQKVDKNEIYFYHPVRDSYQMVQYSVKQKQQKRINTVFKFPSQFAICSVKSMVYFCGGLTNGAKACNDVYSINQKGEVSMNIAPMIRARYRHSLAGDEKNLVATGDVGCLKQCEHYDIRKDLWVPIHNLNIGRREHASVIFTKGIYVFSGYSSHGFEHTIEFTKGIKNAWKVLDGNSFLNCNNLTAVKMNQSSVLIFGRGGEQISTYYVNDSGLIQKSFKQKSNFHTAPDYGGAVRDGKVYLFSKSVYFWNESSKKWF